MFGQSLKEQTMKEFRYSFCDTYEGGNGMNHKVQLKLVSVEAVRHLVVSSRW